MKVCSECKYRLSALTGLCPRVKIGSVVASETYGAGCCAYCPQGIRRLHSDTIVSHNKWVQMFIEVLNKGR